MKGWIEAGVYLFQEEVGYFSTHWFSASTELYFNVLALETKFYLGFNDVCKWKDGHLCANVHRVDEWASHTHRMCINDPEFFLASLKLNASLGRLFFYFHSVSSFALFVFFFIIIPVIPGAPGILWKEIFYGFISVEPGLFLSHYGIHIERAILSDWRTSNESAIKREYNAHNVNLLLICY